MHILVCLLLLCSPIYAEVYTWKSGARGDWSEEKNWFNSEGHNGFVPGPDDEAVISSQTAGSQSGVVVRAEPVVVRKITIGGVPGSASLLSILTQPVTVLGSLSIDPDGLLRLENTLNVSGGMFVHGALNWLSGELCGTGYANVTGVLRFQETGPKTLNNFRVNIFGETFISDGFIQMKSNSQLAIHYQSAFLSNRSDGADPLVMTADDSTSTFSVIGTAQFKSNGFSQQVNAKIELQEKGVLEVQTGILELSMSSVFKGTVSVNEQATVEIIAGYHEFEGDIVGKGQLQVSKGEFEFQGNEFALPVATLDGEYAVLSFHSQVKLPKLSLLDGTLSGGSTARIDVINWQGGKINITGLNVAELVLYTQKATLQKTQLVISQQLNFDEDTAILLVNGPQITVTKGASITANAAVNISYAPGDAVPVLHIDGTLTVSTPKVVTLSATTYISRQATFDVTAGSVEFTDPIYVEGQLFIRAGANITIGKAATFELPSKTTGAGTLICSRDCDALMKGTFAVSTVTVMGQLDLERTGAWLDPTTLDFKITKLSLLGAGVLSIDSSYDGQLTVAVNTLDFQGGSLESDNSDELSGPVLVAVQTLNMFGSNPKTLQDVTLLVQTTKWTDESNLFFKGLTTYNISKSFDVSGAMTALQQEPIIRPTKMIINSGAQFTVNKEMKASIDPPVVNYGRLVVNASELALTRNYEQYYFNGTATTILAGGVLKCSQTIIHGGLQSVLKGYGNIIGSVSLGGLLVPTGGALKVSKDLNHPALGTIQIGLKVGQTAFEPAGTIEVGELYDLDSGVLDLSGLKVPISDPPMGELTQIISFGNITDPNFGSVLHVDLDFGLGFELVYSDSSVSLRPALAPVARRIYPRTGVAEGNSFVYIYGEAFPATTDELHVMFGDAECTNVTIVDNETITCNSPPGTGLVPICVLIQKRGCYQPPALFTYFAPTIYAIAPQNGPTTGATMLTIQGHSFGNFADRISCTVGESPCTNLKLIATGYVTVSLGAAQSSQRVITCLSPPGVGENVKVVVTVSGQASEQSGNTTIFNYDPPEVLFVYPEIVRAGGTLNVFGANFLPSYPYTKFQEVIRITVGSVPCLNVSQASLTQLTCNVPDGPSGWQTVIVTSGGQRTESTKAVLYDSVTYSNLVMWLSVGIGCLVSLALGVFLGSRLCSAKANKRHTLAGERDSLIRANSINRESEVESVSNFEDTFQGDPFAADNKGKEERSVPGNTPAKRKTHEEQYDRRPPVAESPKRDPIVKPPKDEPHKAPLLPKDPQPQTPPQNPVLIPKPQKLPPQPLPQPSPPQVQRPPVQEPRREPVVPSLPKPEPPKVEVPKPTVDLTPTIIPTPTPDLLGPAIKPPAQPQQPQETQTKPHEPEPKPAEPVIAPTAPEPQPQPPVQEIHTIPQELVTIQAIPELQTEPVVIATQEVQEVIPTVPEPEPKVPEPTVPEPKVPKPEVTVPEPTVPEPEAPKPEVAVPEPKAEPTVPEPEAPKPEFRLSVDSPQKQSIGILLEPKPEPTHVELQHVQEFKAPQENHGPMLRVHGPEDDLPREAPKPKPLESQTDDGDWW